MARKRKSLSERKLTTLIEKQQYKCYYCDDPIISLNYAIKKLKITRTKHDLIYYLANGKEYRIKRANLEHKIPKAMGGTNTDDNLAAVCVSCNQKRSKELSKKLHWELSRKSRPFCQCGKSKLIGEIRCVDCCHKNDIGKRIYKLINLNKNPPSIEELEIVFKDHPLSNKSEVFKFFLEKFL